MSVALRFYGRTAHGSHQWKPASHRHKDALKPMKHPGAAPPQGGGLHFRDASSVFPFGDGKTFNPEPDEGELQAINLALPPTSAAASNAVNCAEQI